MTTVAILPIYDDSGNKSYRAIFHPRLNQWKEHFQADATSGIIIGMTSIGRTTVVVWR